MSRITNETLAALMTTYHEQAVEELKQVKAECKEIKAEQKITNGRLRKAESDIAVLQAVSDNQRQKDDTEGAFTISKKQIGAFLSIGALVGGVIAKLIPVLVKGLQ